MSNKERGLHFQQETASATNGAILSLDNPVFVPKKPGIETISDTEYRIPLFFGLNIKERTFHIIPLMVTIPKWIEDPKSPQFIRLHRLAETLLVDISHQDEEIPFILLPTIESLLDLLFRFLSPSANTTFNKSLLELILHQPEELRSILSENQNLPEEPTDDFYFYHPQTNETIFINGESELSTSRQALLLLAILLDNPHSGPEQLLRAIHQKPNTEDFLDYLVDRTIELDEMSSKANIEVSKDEELSSKEINSTIGNNTATNIISFATIRRSYLERSNPQSKKALHDAEKNMKQSRHIIGQQRFSIPKEDKEIDKNKRDKNHHLSESFKEQLQLLRSHDKWGAHESEDIIFSLLQFHIGRFPVSINEIYSSLEQVFEKDITQLSHEEVAIILSVEMEILTRVDNEENYNEVEEKVLQLAIRIHELGLHFINAKLGDVHDPLMIHMSGVDFCLIHTPPQLQMLSNLSSGMQGIATSLTTHSISPSFGLSSLVQRLPSISAGLPLLAQAFASSGETLGATFTGSGQSNNNDADSSPEPATKKPKTKKTKKKKPKAEVFSQPLSGGTEDNKDQKKPPTKKKPKKDKIKEKASQPKKKEKGKPTISPVVVPKKEKPTQHKKKDVHAVAKKPEKPSKPKKIKQPPQSEKPIQVDKPKEAPKPSKKPPERKAPPVVVERKVKPIQPVRPRREVLVHSGGNKKTKRSSNTEQSIPSRTTSRSSGTGSFTQRLREVYRSKDQDVNQSTTRRVEVTKDRTVIKRTNSKTKNEEKETTTIVAPQREERVEEVNTQEVKVEIQTEQDSEQKNEVVTNDSKVVQVETDQDEEVVENITVEEEESVDKKEDESTNESPVTTAVGFAAGAIFKVGRRISANNQPDEVPSASLTRDIVTEVEPAIPSVAKGVREDSEIVKTKRKQREFGGSRGSGPSPTVKKKKKSTHRSDKATLTVAMRRLPTNSIVDTSDSFTMAREIRGWFDEAWQNPEYVKRFYSQDDIPKAA